MELKPYIIPFESHGSDNEGFLNVATSGEGFPFEIKRVFWVYQTPPKVTRGRHAHYQTEMVLIAIKGTIIIKTEFSGKIMHFTLSAPNMGLYIPRLCWHEMKYRDDAIQLVLASSLYHNDDYIRDYEKFKKISTGDGKD